MRGNADYGIEMRKSDELLYGIIKCDLCGELGIDYEDYWYDSPDFRKIDEYKKLCKDCYGCGTGKY